MITNYSELQTAIANWLNRSDLTTVIPDLISLVEERLNRDLRVKEMEAAFSETVISSNRIAVPDGVVGVKVFWVPGYESTPLHSQSFETVLAFGDSVMPTMWAWQGADWYFNGSGSVQGVVYSEIPALSSSSTTNWLLAANPSLYLFGALYEAAVYVKDSDAEARFGTRFNALIDTLNGNDMRNRLNGPLVARAR